MEKFLTKHFAILGILGGIISTIVTLTAYAYTTFVTKDELNTRLTRIEIQLQSIDEFLRKN